MFSGNNIQFKKILRIPLDSSTTSGGIEVMKQKDTHEVLIQKFKNATNEMTLEARSYLEESNWNLKDAVSRWEEDSRWESRVRDSATIQQQQSDMFKTLPIDEDEVDTEVCRFVPPMEVVTVEGVGAGDCPKSSAEATISNRTNPHIHNLYHAIPIPPVAVQYDPPVLVDVGCGRNEEQLEAEMILARPYESTCTVPLLG